MPDSKQRYPFTSIRNPIVEKRQSSHPHNGNSFLPGKTTSLQWIRTLGPFLHVWRDGVSQQCWWQHQTCRDATAPQEHHTQTPHGLVLHISHTGYCCGHTPAGKKKLHVLVLQIYEIQLYKVLIDGLVQERHNSSALAMELRLSCTNPLIWMRHIQRCLLRQK